MARLVMTKKEQFDKELRDLCNKYMEDFAVCIIVEDNFHSYAISGNLCVVCARDALIGFVDQNNSKHNRMH